MTTDSIATRSGGRASKDCVHHWLIEPADGPISHGSCKRCGMQRDFSNSAESAIEEVEKSGATVAVPRRRWS